MFQRRGESFLEVRMCEGRRFQADGAATEKELFESWRLDRRTINAADIQQRNAIIRIN